MTTYPEARAALAASSAAATVGAWQVLPPTEFIGVGAALVARFNLRAVALADLAFASLMRSLPLGLGRPDGDEERLLVAFGTLVDRIAEAPPESALARVERIATAEPLHAGQVAYGEALQVHASTTRPVPATTAPAPATTAPAPIAAAPVPVAEPEPEPQPERERVIVGWRRVLNPDACELCRWWYRGGFVYPPERLMRTHISCACSQEVVLDTKEGAA